VLPFQAAVEGFCDPGFEPLRDAFRANFAERGELGAAVCVIVSNAVVADLYGGWADQEQGRRWQPDTLVNVFSVGKGLAAACTARLTPPGRHAGLAGHDHRPGRTGPLVAARNRPRLPRQHLRLPGGEPRSARPPARTAVPAASPGYTPP
jgi:hypothetical protein